MNWLVQQYQSTGCIRSRLGWSIDYLPPGDLSTTNGMDVVVVVVVVVVLVVVIVVVVVVVVLVIIDADGDACRCRA